ncbi:putative Pre-rRNA-processing protein esf1 [Venustampulla echinocandica]|uniref:Putative Pre-rRNA-processing protein esf1 n=1 Tax=Venustampulla echinocandica TaxID=2656787 RepID=A0A370TWL1_9HELO|nr:putative Pre-rRNA-processing protein esf1 [Venustampulla echinocandica]RDL39915.1 putative Pre-rRNA-processing protein esf1 [Venustampulla echinocandica]
MPKQKQKAPKGAASTAVSTETDINDPRFSNFTTDPRFRLPSKKHTRTKVDKRFSRMLKDEDFSNTARVDRYGRKLSSAGKKKALERLYVPDEEEQDGEGEVDVEVEDDDVIQKELGNADSAYDPARGGGFSSSEDEDDDDDEEDGGVEIEEAAFPDMQAEQAAVEMGEISSRVAVVNLDWDNIRSIDLMAVFSSFVPVGGKIHKISIYPSEFGKERMEREELDGPPREIFTSNQADQESLDEDSEDSEDDDQEGEDDEELEEKIKKDLQKADEGQEFNSAALRQYQLERLRYYYAVVICSDHDTAQKIYESTDGTEYLSSANFFDLRFIPDGVEFDDKARDECDSVPSGYRPTEFVTDALQHSKVKLTWDMDPEEMQRKDAIKRAFTGSRAEIGENDLRAYLGSDSEDDEEEEQQAEVAENAAEPKLSKKELERQKLRVALGLSDEPSLRKKKSGPVGDMEITFTAGLSTNGNEGVFENEPIIEETTAEKYVRKERERKARRKEMAKARREGRDPNAAPAEVADGASGEEKEKEDLGFDDPFFATDEVVKEKASKTLRKEERLKKREAKEAEAAAKASQRAELELLMQDNTAEAAERLDHFDINEIARAEKQAKKGKKGKGKKEAGSKRGGLQENFEMDVADERFAGRLFGHHEFAIDPSNPKYKGTEGMKKLLEEGRKKRHVEGDGEDVNSKAKKRKVEGAKGELSSLVESVKKKSKR